MVIAPGVNSDAALRVACKTQLRECLHPGCTNEMVACGLCRSHYDAAHKQVKHLKTTRARKAALEKLIRCGLMFSTYDQPRKKRAAPKAAAFLAALSSMEEDCGETKEAQAVLRRGRPAEGVRSRTAEDCCRPGSRSDTAGSRGGTADTALRGEACVVLG